MGGIRCARSGPPARRGKLSHRARRTKSVRPGIRWSRTDSRITASAVRPQSWKRHPPRVPQKRSVREFDEPESEYDRRQGRTTRRALVTGGAGFFGSHLCDGLLAEGYRVLAADNLLTGRLTNIEHLKNDSRFEFVEKDVCEPGDYGALDYVFHFASPASPFDYAKHGIATLRVGSYGTFEALETARRSNAKFMMASTSECYGDPSGPSPARNLLGQRQSHRSALGVRRGQAFFGSGDHGLSPLSQRRHAHSAHLQHLRTAHADQRRPRDSEFYVAGAARRRS